VSLRSEFRVVMSVTISLYKRCSVLLYLQLFVGGFISYLRYLCLFAHSGVQHIYVYWVVFLFCFCPSSVPLGIIHILDCVFILFLSVVCTPRYSLTFT
jgi:ABC-type Co2+ transport system permease subunit